MVANEIRGGACGKFGLADLQEEGDDQMLVELSLYVVDLVGFSGLGWRTGLRWIQRS